jgi:hypothetical protein
MGEIVKFRADNEWARLPRGLKKPANTLPFEVMISAKRAGGMAMNREDRPTAAQVYLELYPRLTPRKVGQALRDWARNASRFLKEILLARRRQGAL